MTAKPMRTLRGEPGDTFIRPSNHWADRAAPAPFACAWLIWGGHLWSAMDDIPAARLAESTFGLWLKFAFWLIVFALLCALTAWSFLGATKISVSSDELIASHCLAGQAIFASRPMKLSNVRDVRIKERKGEFRGNKWHCWALLLHLEDGSTRQVAKFTNDLDADAFLKRYVR